MHNREYGDYSRLLRMPELRSPGVRHEIVRVKPPQTLHMHMPDKACLYVVRRGNWLLHLEGNDEAGDILLEPGAAVGTDPTSSLQLTALASPGSGKGELAEILIGNVDWRHTIIQKIAGANIVMPSTAEPHATIVGHIASIIEADLARIPVDDALQRRCAELMQIELLHYGQAKLERIGPIPDAVNHDAALLRAWTAFLGEPARRWTISALAQVAGISRTTFAVRFGRAVGASPISALRWLRVHYAAEMLRMSQAPVSEIAVTVGYGSDIALMRAFRREFGVTPAQWRKNAGKTGESVISRGYIPRGDSRQNA